MNLRPSGYEPDELPGCSTPRGCACSGPDPGFGGGGLGWKTWRRPTLPRLEAQYHGRWGVSRPSSGWDRVRAPRRRPPGRPAHRSAARTLRNGVPRRAGSGAPGSVRPDGAAGAGARAAVLVRRIGWLRGCVRVRVAGGWGPGGSRVADCCAGRVPAVPIRRPWIMTGNGGRDGGIEPVGRLGPVSCAPRGASTPGLST